MRIEESVSVITGGSSGLGEAVVRYFHSLGGKIAIWDLNENLGTRIASELGNKVIFCKVNVTNEDSVKAALKETITRLGNIEVLLNCAGIFAPSATITPKLHSLSKYERIINVNLIGTFNVSRIIAKHIAEQNGSSIKGEGFRERGVIVNVSSIAATQGQSMHVAYSSSKAGILGMTLPLARDLANYGIRVNTIAPGMFGPTGMTANIDKQTYEESFKQCPLKRWGHPEEFAHTVKFLVENTYMNGASISLDAAANLANI